jgi:hypothetical protein
MWDLLTPDARPAIWQRPDAGYDQKKLGLEITAYDRLPADVKSAEQKRQYYQTSLHGARQPRPSLSAARPLGSG